MMSVTVRVTVDKRLTCVDRDTVSVGEHINQKVSFSFGHYPELPPLTPIRATWSSFSRLSITKNPETVIHLAL